jgi:hypothetical protein
MQIKLFNADSNSLVLDDLAIRIDLKDSSSVSMLESVLPDTIKHDSVGYYIETSSPSGTTSTVSGIVQSVSLESKILTYIILGVVAVAAVVAFVFGMKKAS